MRELPNRSSHETAADGKVAAVPNGAVAKGGPPRVPQPEARHALSSASHRLINNGCSNALLDKSEIIPPMIGDSTS